MANFSHRRVYSSSLHYLMSISAIDPFCPLAILPMRVTLFPSVVLCVTSILSINGNDALYCSKLSGEHAGESFTSLRCIVFEICYCKVEKLSIFLKI